MIKNRIFFAIGIVFLLFFVFVYLYSRKNVVMQAKQHVLSESTNSHQVLFFDSRTFYDGVSQVKEKHPFQSYSIRGGIIPHHLFPGFIIADLFYRISQQHPRTIILIGPNHYEKGKYHVLTSLYSWETPFGKVEPDLDIIHDLIKQQVIHADETVLPNDHAVAGSIPFIKYYMPQTRVVPLLISGFTPDEEIRTLAKAISTHLQEDVVFVAPVDFSHYLTSDEAKKKDAVTFDTLKNFDYEQLFTLNNDYLDSPPSIATLLMAMQEIHATTMELLYHTNSGDLQHSPYISTTSYFSMIYH